MAGASHPIHPEPRRRPPGAALLATSLLASTLLLTLLPGHARAQTPSDGPRPGPTQVQLPPGPTQVQCADCPPARLADAQHALDEGLRRYARGLAEDNARILDDAVVLFRHGYAQSQDPVFLLHQTAIDLRAGTCGPALASFAAFAQAGRRVHRFAAEISALGAEMRAFRRECAWQGQSAPAAMERRLQAFARSHAGQPVRVQLAGSALPLRIHCPLGAVCDSHADYRMLLGHHARLHVQVVLGPEFVGQEATMDVAKAFRYADFNVHFPELESTTWKVTADSFQFLMRAGDARIRSLRVADGQLHLSISASIGQLQAFSTIDRCQVRPAPKACILRVPASMPLELELHLPFETGPLDCKDKNTPERALRCG